MYEISDYENKSERVRRLMLLDDVEENAALYAHQIANDFSDAHFCNRTRVVLEVWTKRHASAALPLTIRSRARFRASTTIRSSWHSGALVSRTFAMSRKVASIGLSSTSTRKG